MKSKAKVNQYANFEDALKKVLKVSHADMQDKIAAGKKERKPKTSASARVSSGKD